MYGGGCRTRRSRPAIEKDHSDEGEEEEGGDKSDTSLREDSTSPLSAADHSPTRASIDRDDSPTLQVRDLFHLLGNDRVFIVHREFCPHSGTEEDDCEIRTETGQLVDG